LLFLCRPFEIEPGRLKARRRARRAILRPQASRHYLSMVCRALPFPADDAVCVRGRAREMNSLAVASDADLGPPSMRRVLACKSTRGTLR
jgi:hypothetical protein